MKFQKIFKKTRKTNNFFTQPFKSMLNNDKKNFLSEISKFGEKILNQSRNLFHKQASIIFPEIDFSEIQIGVELEFYLLKEQTKLAVSDKQRLQFIKNLSDSCQLSANEVFFKTEQGNGQIEVVFFHQTSLVKLCKQFESEKKRIFELAKIFGLLADFSALPFQNDCGSALQFNLSLLNRNKENLFEKNPELQKNCANKLLAATNFMILLMIGEPNDLERYDSRINQRLFAHGKHVAPVNLSFGFNNRSCAIRLLKTRLEYRVPCANSNIWLALSAVLIALSLESHSLLVQNFEPIFGNAFDENYQIVPIYSDFSAVCEQFFDSRNLIYQQLNSFLGID